MKRNNKITGSPINDEITSYSEENDEEISTTNKTVCIVIFMIYIHTYMIYIIYIYHT
jgi:hypothetical protein